MKVFTLLISMLLAAAPAAAQSIKKLAEFKRGEVSEVDVSDILPTSAQLYVVGVINKAGNAMLFMYRGAEETSRSQVELGGASSIAVANIANPNNGRSGRFVSAMRDSQGNLRVILWGVSENGRELVRLHTVTGPKIRKVDVESVSSGDGLVAAVKENGNLMVRSLLYSNDDRLSLPSGTTYGPAKDIQLESGLVSGLAMQQGDGRLKVTSFNQSGETPILRNGSAGGGKISSLDIATMDGGDVGLWATITSSAPVNPDPFFNHCLAGPFVVPYAPIGQGKLIAWQRESIFDDELKRIAERDFVGRGGLAHEVAATNYGYRWNTLITGHLGYGKRCGFKPRLELHLWDFDEDDGFDKRATATLGGDYRNLAIANFGIVTGKQRFVTAMRGRVDRELKIVVWEASTFD